MSEGQETTNEMEFATPKGLRPGSQLDARFPISYQSSVPEAMRVIIEYFKALSQRDMAGVAKSLHFPFALYEDIDPVVVESESALLNNPPATINVTGKGETQVMEGSYDLLERLELQTFSPVAAVLTMSFMRYTLTAINWPYATDCMSSPTMMGNGPSNFSQPFLHRVITSALDIPKWKMPCLPGPAIGCWDTTIGIRPC